MAFIGTSNTEANPTGYRPIIQRDLVRSYDNIQHTFILSAYPGSGTWQRLWYNERKVIPNNPNIVVYEAVRKYVNPQIEKAIEEGAVRRLRNALPSCRLLIIGLPVYDNLSQGNIINTAQLAHLSDIATYYDATYLDVASYIRSLVNSGDYTLPGLYNDVVHPSTTGHELIAGFLRETLDRRYILSRDVYSGDLTDYPAQFNGDQFDTPGDWICRYGVDNDGETGSWQTDGTIRYSSDAGATITFTGTFQTYGIEYLLDNAISVETRINGSGWVQNNYRASEHTIHSLGMPGVGTHTIEIRVVSGTVKVKRFLAI